MIRVILLIFAVTGFISSRAPVYPLSNELQILEVALNNTDSLTPGDTVLVKLKIHLESESRALVWISPRRTGRRADGYFYQPLRIPKGFDGETETYFGLKRAGDVDEVVVTLNRDSSLLLAADTFATSFTWAKKPVAGRQFQARATTPAVYPEKDSHVIWDFEVARLREKIRRTKDDERILTRKLEDALAQCSADSLIYDSFALPGIITPSVAVISGRKIHRYELLPDRKEFNKNKKDLTLREFQEWLGKFQAVRLNRLIYPATFEKYARKNRLTPSYAETARHFKEIKSWSSYRFYSAILKTRNLAKSLFENYGGGRVAISSFGYVVAVDASEKYLREQMANGVFSINDDVLAEAFWKLVLNEKLDALLSETKASEMFTSPDY